VKQSLRIVFFGTSAFAASLLTFLDDALGCEIVAVVTRQDKPQGRNLELLPSAVKKFVLESTLSCPLFQPVKASTDECAEELKKLKADLFVVVAYGEIIKQNLLDLPRFGCINIHASLLPRYRGASPIHRAIMNGEKETGITIIEMVQALDAGPMLNKEAVSIGENENLSEVEAKLIEAACRAVLKTIEQIADSKVVKEPQDEKLATYAPKLSADEERIDWKRSAREVHNLIRAFSPQPGAWCKISFGNTEKRMKIYRTEVLEEYSGAAGQVLEKSKNALIVACGSGALKLLEVQIEGKRSMQIKEFLQGVQAHQPLHVI
jgi:methionyl-tRNA formyltransferase